MEVIKKYFGDFSDLQLQQFEALGELYKNWNQQINVISRKDIEQLYPKHILHSLSIAAIADFADKTRVLDIGTGGGFPGIPLAIFYPDVEFVLCDSINKKLNVVRAIAEELKLDNVAVIRKRAEEIKHRNSFDFAVSRAVAPLAKLWRWSSPLIRKGTNNELDNGLICLKGGDLNQEISESNTRPMMWDMQTIFDEPDVFEEKYVLYVKK
jgi:16S rRNA (guanine527-N7)-methyltransferase